MDDQRFRREPVSQRPARASAVTLDVHTPAHYDARLRSGTIALDAACERAWSPPARERGGDAVALTRVLRHSPTQDGGETGGTGMSTVTVDTIVDRPPTEVFRFVATDHFENHPRWDPDVIEMHQTSPGPVRVGTTASVVRRQGRGRLEGAVTVVAYDPDRVAAWDVSFGRFRLLQRSEFAAENDGTATRLRLTIETRASGPMRLLVPLLRTRFRRTMNTSLNAIRELVEATSGARAS